MLYYLETNALYHLSGIKKEILTSSYTSAFSLIELVSGISESNYAKRKTVLSMIRDFKLTIDTASQEEVVFNTFDVFDDYEFVELRYVELQKLIQAIINCETYLEYSLTDVYDAEYGAAYFRHLDDHMSSNFITSSVLGIQTMKQVIQNPETIKQIDYNGNAYNLESSANIREFLLANPSFNHLITLQGLAAMIRSKGALPDLSIKEIIDSYNGLIDTYVDTLSRFCTNAIFQGKTPAKNDFADLTHLLYLKNDPEKYIVSNDKIFMNYLPDHTIAPEKIKN